MMRVFYHDIFTFPLPRGHRFPAAKYRLLREMLHQRGIVRAADLHLAPAATVEQLAHGHTSAYIARVLQGTLSRAEVRRIGLPWSPQLVERARRSVGSTWQAALAALRTGLAVNLGGGTHHAGPDWGAGYCLFNDVAVTGRGLLAQGIVQRVVVIDADVHQGDGTAAIAASEPRLFTFSIHGQRNFPFRKVPGDLDVGLPDGTRDRAYLEALRQGLSIVAQRAPQPDLVFYIAGADPWEGDRLGRLALTKEGLRERDRFVLTWALAQGAAVVIVLGGGYATDLHDTADIHARTIALARTMAPDFAAARATPRAMRRGL